jgi:hypothetical protein
MLSEVLMRRKHYSPGMLTCFIRYEIDPYFMWPHPGTDDVAWGLISFRGMAEYEAYHLRLAVDPAARANFDYAQLKRFILREDRTFFETVDGTLDRPA